MHRTLGTPLLCAALALLGCGDAPTELAPRTASQPAAASEPAAAAQPTTASADAPAAVSVVDPTRAGTVASTTAKASDNLGFDLAALARVHAIEATPVVPSWAASAAGDPAAVRDDDLDTAIRCTPGGATPCAIGLSLADPTEITAVRLFAAAGPRWHDYRAHPTPERIRVHTDAGWIDATLDDGATHHYVVFAAPVTTRTLAIEIVSVRPGTKKDTPVVVAELDVFGPSGPPRPALAFDPTRAFVAFETDAWKAGASSNTIRIDFVELADPGGEHHRYIRGTAIHGRPGDRFVAIERMYADDCTHAKGGYLLLDRTTRVIAPLGDLGALPGELLLHPEGLGILVRRPGEDGSARAVVFDGTALVRHKPKQKQGETDAQLAARLGFTDAPVHRGGHPVGASADGCESGSTEAALVARVATATEAGAALPEDATICPLSQSHRVVIGTAGGCGGRTYAAVIGPGDDIVGSMHTKTEDGRGAWWARHGEDAVVIEASSKGGARSALWRAEAGGIATLAEAGSLAVRRPPGCDACNGDYGITSVVTPADTDAADPPAPADAPQPAVDPEPATPRDDGATPGDEGSLPQVTDDDP